jgi:hypothetical protein
VIAPVAGIPHSAREPIPSCHTSVITPHAAPTETTFSTTAFSGSSSERNARASNANVTSAISAIITGNDPYTACTKSALDACSPPTCTSPPAAASTAVSVAAP